MPRPRKSQSPVRRRDFLKMSAATVGVLGTAGVPEGEASAGQPSTPEAAAGQLSAKAPGWGGDSRYNGVYTGERLSRVALPMGGIGAGMICLEGTGALSHFSLRNKPEVFNEPLTFAAVCVKGETTIARVLEGPVPDWKKFGAPGAGNGASGTSFGLPRFRHASFSARFPFGVVTLTDGDVPLGVEITGWSPFEPGDADNSSLPVAALEYRFSNTAARPVEAVFSWHARNFMAIGENAQAVMPAPGGFVLGGRGRRGPRLGGGRVLRHGRRSGGEGEPRMVPRRLVGPAHDGVERGRPGCLLRSGARRRREGEPPARRSSCRSRSPPVRPGRSSCASPGTWAGRISASARTRKRGRRPDRALARTRRGTPGGSPGSTT